MLRKLAGQTLIYGLSTVVPRVINYMLAPYLTYIALSEADFGLIGYFYAIIPFALSILLMGMENGYFRFMGKEDNPEKREEVFYTIWNTTVIFSLLFFLFVYIYRGQIYRIIDEPFIPSIILMVAGIIVADVISSIPFASLREQGRSMRFSVMKGLSVIINVVLVIFFYSVLPLVKDWSIFSFMWVEGFGAGYFILSNLIASTAITVILCLTTGIKVKLKINFELLKKVLLFSIPLFIGGLAGTANEYLDRFFIKGLIVGDNSLEQLGIYSATLKITAIMAIFTQMYRYAAEPMFLSKLKKDDFKEHNAIALKFFVVACMLIFLIITIYIDIFKLLLAPSFREAIPLVPMMLISASLVGVLLNLNFWYKHAEKTHFAIIITSLGLLVSVLVNLFLIPKLGIKGAVVAKLISVLFMVVLSYILNQVYYRTKYNLLRIMEYAWITAVAFYAGRNTNIDTYIIDFLVKGMIIVFFTIYVLWREKLLSKIIKIRNNY